MPCRMSDTLSERISQRLAELADTRGFRMRLARRLNLSPPAITPYTTGERPVNLDMLEAMAELSGRPVAELVAPPGTIYQLNAEEAAIIRRLRLWPASVMRALGAFLAFFADEPPEVRLSRNMHELWRGLETRDREWLFGIAVMLRERSLAPDHLAGLVEQLKAEAATAAKAKRRRDDA